MDIEVLFTPGHSPGHLTYAIGGAAAVRRRPLPGLGRARRPPRRGLGDARALDRGPAAAPIPPRPSSTPATWASRRSGASATPTRSSASFACASRASRAAAWRRRSRTLSEPKIKAPRGTFDVLGDQVAARLTLETRARSLLERAGYERIETPAFEATELFARGVGESTDIVQQGDVHASRTPAGAR